MLQEGTLKTGDLGRVQLVQVASYTSIDHCYLLFNCHWNCGEGEGGRRERRMEGEGRGGWREKGEEGGRRGRRVEGEGGGGWREKGEEGGGENEKREKGKREKEKSRERKK